MVPQESKTASRSSEIQRASRLALSRRGAMAVCAFTVASFTLPFASALAHRFALILPALTIRSPRTEVAGVFSAGNGAILDDPMLLVQPAPWRADLWSCVRARAVCVTPWIADDPGRAGATTSRPHQAEWRRAACGASSGATSATSSPWPCSALLAYPSPPSSPPAPSVAAHAVAACTAARAPAPTPPSLVCGVARRRPHAAAVCSCRRDDDSIAPRPVRQPRPKWVAAVAVHCCRAAAAVGRSVRRKCASAVRRRVARCACDCISGLATHVCGQRHGTGSASCEKKCGRFGASIARQRALWLCARVDLTVCRVRHPGMVSMFETCGTLNLVNSPLYTRLLYVCASVSFRSPKYIGMARPRHR